MIDIERQLTQYGAFHDDQFGPVTVDDILEEPVGQGPVRTLQPRRAKRPLDGWAYAAVAAAAVLLLVGGAGVLLRVTGSDLPVATTPQIDSLSSLTWSRVPHDEAVFGGDGNQEMESVTAGGPGLVAVGSVGLNDDGDAAVWTSTDGITWSRVPHDESVFGGPNTQRMLSVIAGGPGLVAVGTEGGVAERDWDAAVWTSIDGITWSRVPHDEEVFGGAESQAMASVTVGGPGLVAVGGPGHECDPCWSEAAVWTSVDGITWSRVPHDEVVFGGEIGATMDSVTAGGPGLVAVGSASPIHIEADGGEDGDPDAAVWTSVDGITWSRVPDDEAVFGGAGHQEMADVAVGGPGLVAVGSVQLGDDEFATHNPPDAAVWTSVDGITWSRVPHDEAVFGGAGPHAMAAVTVARTGLVAVGYDGGPDSAVWTSVDGITWSRVTHDEAVFGGTRMSSVTVAGPGLVAVGQGWWSEPGTLDAVVWTGISED